MGRRATRRTFTASYKAAILAEADAATAPGAIGALLEREGLYSSHLVAWRRLRAQGGIEALQPRPTGRPSKWRKVQVEMRRLEAENDALRRRVGALEGLLEAWQRLLDDVSTGK